MYKNWKKKSKVTRKTRRIHISHENPKSFWALRQAPDPTPRYARFTRQTPLCYVGKIGRTRAAPPLDQILDPLLMSTGPLALFLFPKSVTHFILWHGYLQCFYWTMRGLYLILKAYCCLQGHLCDVRSAFDRMGK